ncbi:MAG: insulinase family protein, partial [Paramuribaculum sp.]|nr:insulinase family protein [Paramuribaculum sp.]
EEIEVYQENVKTEPLIENLPAPGKIVKEQTLKQWDATEWTLSNGVKVIVKPTDFKDNEIQFAAVALNGLADVKNARLADIKFLSTALGQCGLGTYTNSDLSKYMAGKQAMVTPSVRSYTRSVGGFSTPKDLPSLMELIYMSFTGVNFSEDEFAALQSNTASMIKNMAKNPTYVFQTKLPEALYPDNDRMRAITVDDVMNASREGVVDLAHKMTANAADYTFVFIGNIDMATFRPLVEHYIATLPANAKNASKKIKNYSAEYQLKPGKGVETFTTPMETPQTWCYITAFGKEPFSMKNSQLASVAGQILTARLVEIVREKEGAVYSISASGQMDRLDPTNVEIVSAFPMKPEMKDKVLDIIAGQIKALETDVDQAELDKIKEYMLKSFKEKREQNEGWLSAIDGWLINGVDTFNGNDAVISSITVDDVKNFMKNLNKQGNYRVVILDPEN